MMGGGNPLFNMENKTKNEITETNELLDSEDDYDMNSEIYAEPDISKIETDIIEIKLEIKSIIDLIQIGTKYKLIQEEKTKEDKIEKEKEIKLNLDSQVNSQSNKSDENIIKSKNGIIIIKNKKNKTDFENDLTKIIDTAFNEAFSEAFGSLKIGNLTDKKNKEPEKNSKYYDFFGDKYSVDIKKLINLVEPLKKLQNMIGMTKIKENILEMILYYVQNFEQSTSDMLHTSIEGPPGVGKTKLGRILAQVYHALGVIPSTRFKRVRRTDLIGKYLGHTAHKTQSVIDEAEGGVLFIDEAYSLGNSDGEKDIYSKECIDTINMNLTEKKKNLIVIIAGYTDQLDKSFFAVNEGLKRRFPFRFTIEGYDEKEMRDIFFAQVRRMKWHIQQEVSSEYLEEFFKTNKKDLPHFGGDIETILLNCKMTHAKRVLGKPYIYHKILSKEDISNAFDRFKQNKKKKENTDHLHSMYS